MKYMRKIPGAGFAFIILITAAFAMETGILKGKVMDVEGKAVKGVEVFVYNTPDTRRPADFISARSDMSGRFSLAVPPGKFWAVARLRQGEKYGPLMPGDKHSGEPVEIEVKAGEEFEQDFTIVDIRDAARLMRKTREDYVQIKGRILDAQGTPLKNVYAIAGREKEISEIPDYLSAWTDEGGRYILYLPAGTYVIGYASEFPPGKNIYFYREINIAGESNNVDIVADGAGSLITGQD